MAAPSILVSIIGLLTAGLNVIKLLARRAAALSPRQRAARAAHAARQASAQGDARAVNALAERHRLDTTLLLPLTLALLLLAGCGCGLTRARERVNKETAPDPVPEVVVIPADRYQYLTTNAVGVVGWFVPLAVHAEMMEALALVSYYRQSFNHSSQPLGGRDKKGTPTP